MLDIEGLPLARHFGRIRMLGIFRFSIVPGIYHHGRTVRHYYQCRVSSTGSDGVNVQITFLPLRKILLRLRTNTEGRSRQRNCK